VSASEHEEAQNRLASLRLRDHDLSERIDSIETFIASVHETLNGTPTDTEMIIYVLSQQRGKMEEMVCFQSLPCSRLLFSNLLQKRLLGTLQDTVEARELQLNLELMEEEFKFWKSAW